jgi:hypothetical protein
VGFAVARLQIEAIAPRRAPLPITETGYRPHFTVPDLAAAAGGQMAFVVASLAEAPKSPQRSSRAISHQQLSLL